MGLDANSKAGTIGKINQKKIRNRSPKFDRQGPHLAASSMMALQPFLAASNPLFFGAFVGVEMEGMKVEEAYFRGGKLQGARLSITNGCSAAGFVMEKKSLGKRKVSDISEDNNWEITIRNLRM
ncbi:hypothetical protein H0E87_016767 [Populus deltoides]|uniref:Uncharacterized protein n=1 Tax=Populus deltoides TaxID=3696 RepID=A0A8T2YAS6_POPDE|nr:hypothetical protein H0E87_016767 [Populus deltoides]